MAYRLLDHLLVSAVIGFAVALASAGTALGVWMLFQYSPNRFHALKQENIKLAQANDELRRALSQTPASEGDLEKLKEALTPEVLKSLVHYMQDTCSDIGCSIMRAYCSNEVFQVAYADWRNQYPVANRFPGLQQAVYETIWSYQRAVRRHPPTSPLHEEMIGAGHRSLFESLRAA